MSQDSIWRDEKTGLPIHMHTRPRSDGRGNIILAIQNPTPCDCGIEGWNISKSAGELVKKHEQEQKST